MTEATPIAPTTTTEPTSIIVQPLPKTGMKGGPGSADDLLNAYDEEISADENLVERAADRQVKVKEVTAKKQAAKEVLQSLEQNRGNDEDVESASESDTEEVQEEVAGELEAFLNGEKVTIPENAELEMQLNGKPFKFSVAQAIEAKLGQEKFNRGIEQRLSYATEREKKVDGRVESIILKAQQAIDVAKEGNPLPTIKAMARLAAKNEIEAVEIEREFLEKLDKIKSVYSEMSPSERAQYFAEQRANAAEERLKKVESEAGFSEKVKQSHTEVGQICEKVGLSRDAFVNLYHNFIIPEMVGPGKEFASIDEVGPREVAGVHIEYSTRDKVYTALEEIDPSLAKNHEFAEDLFKQAMQNLSWQKEDIKYIIKQIVSTPSKSVQNLNRKVERAKTQRLNSGLKQGSANKKGEEIDEQLYQEFFRSAEKESWAGKLK